MEVKKYPKIIISALVIFFIAFGFYSYRQNAAAAANQTPELKEAAVNKGVELNR